MHTLWQRLRLSVFSLHEAAFVLAVFSVVSALLALWRTRLLAGTLGATRELDVYYAAFYLPDIVFFTIVLSVSLFVLVPHLTRLSDVQKRQFVVQTVFAFSVVMAAVSAAAYLLAPHFLSWRFASLLASPAGETLLFLTRLLLLQAFLLGVSNIVAAYLQVRGAFVLYALSPILYSLSIIAGIVWVYPHAGLRGLGWAVVFGALLHVLLGAAFLLTDGRFRLPRPWFDWRAFWQVVRRSLPRTAGLALQRIAFVFVASLVASFGVAGMLGQFQIANDLSAAVLNMLGASYSVASFTVLSRQWVRGAVADFARTLQEALGFALFWALPAAGFLFAWSVPVLSVLLGTGAFADEAVWGVAAFLRWFALALPLQIVGMIFMRALYAQHRAWLSLAINALGAAAFAMLAVVLLRQGYAVVDAVGAGVVVGALVVVLGSWLFFVRSGLSCLSGAVFARFAVATAVLTAFLTAVRGILAGYEGLLKLLALGIGGALGMGVWGAVLWVLGDRHVRAIVQKVLRVLADLMRFGRLEKP